LSAAAEAIKCTPWRRFFAGPAWRFSCLLGLACAAPGVPRHRPALAAEPTSPTVTEKAIARAVDTGNGRGLELLAQVVDITCGCYRR
jgi:hypothetical protein